MQRYAEDFVMQTMKDPFDDMLLHLGFLTAEDYLIDVLHTRHGVDQADARARAKKIIPHVKTALAFIEQSVSGRPDVSFLPGYYAVLNLLKIYILFGPLQNQLQANRWHGATYDVYGKDSHNLTTEVITLRSGGAIPLFYRMITGSPLRDKLRLRVSDIYPHIEDVSIEWLMATGADKAQVFLDLATVDVGLSRFTTAKLVETFGRVPSSVTQLKLLPDFRRQPGVPDTFISRTPGAAALSDDEVIRSHIRPFLLYYSHGDYAVTPVSGKDFLFLEELPIILALFHMGSVVRYKPEFLARIQDSKYWPIVATLRVHSLHKFLLLFLSFVQQKNLIIERL